MNLPLDTIIQGNALDILHGLPSESVDCAITSPPYFGLRDYGMADQVGLERTPAEYVAKLVEIFREVRRVLKPEGTLWLNLGDSYAGSWGNYGGQNRGAGTQRAIEKGSKAHQRAYDGKDDWRPPTSGDLGSGIKNKDLIGIPWRTAFALQDDGWYLRQEIIWDKPNPMVESMDDRCTKSHEQIFLLPKSPRYYFDQDAIREPAQNWGTRDRAEFRGGTLDPKLKHRGLKGSDEEEQSRNKRSVWRVATRPFAEAHFAVFPEELVAPMVKAGCPGGGVVLDPFMGAGTTALVAQKLGRHYIGIELNPAYIEIANRRLSQKVLV